MKVFSALLLFTLVLGAVAQVDYVGGRCSFWGDPHITTFDGVYYSYQNTGWFWIMISDQMSVSGHFYPCWADGTAMCVDRIRVNVWGPSGTIQTLVSIISETQADINGVNTKFLGNWGDRQMHVANTFQGVDLNMVPDFQNGDYVYQGIVKQNVWVDLPNTDMTVSYEMSNMGYTLRVRVPYAGYGFQDDADFTAGLVTVADKYAGVDQRNIRRAERSALAVPKEVTKIIWSPRTLLVQPTYSLMKNTCGLCGTFDVRQGNDFVTASGVKLGLDASNIQAFGDSWATSSGAKRMSCDTDYVPSTATTTAASTAGVTTTAATTTAATSTAATTVGATTTAASSTTAAVTTNDASTTASTTTAASTNAVSTTAATTSAATTTAVASTTAAVDGTTAAASYASTTTTASSTTAAASTTVASTTAATTTAATTTAATTTAATTTAATTTAATTTAATTTAATTTAATTTAATSTAATTAGVTTTAAASTAATTTGATTAAATTAAASTSASSTTAASSTAASSTTAAAAAAATTGNNGRSGTTTSRADSTTAAAAGATTGRGVSGSTTGSRGSTTTGRSTTGGSYIDDGNSTAPAQNGTILQNNTMLDFINSQQNTPAFTAAQQACDNAGFPRSSYQYTLCMFDVLSTNNTGVANDGVSALVSGCALNDDNATLTDCFKGTPYECPQGCNGNGKCVNGKCDCVLGYGGDSCYKTGLNAAEIAGVVSAGAVAAIAIGAAAFVALTGFGAKKGYDYLKNRDNNMGGVSSNPLYQEKKAGGTNPLYDTKA